jgi:hypothetical protein
VSNAAGIKFSRTSVTISPGQTARITATFTPPTGLDVSTLPVYSGWVTIISSTESLQVPYLGAAAALKDKRVLDTSDYYFDITLPAILDANGNPQTEPTNYTFTDSDYPSLLARLTFGTASFTADVVGASSNSTLGNLFDYPYTPRNDDGSFPYYLFDILEPLFANGTAIPPGSYRILVKALRVTGNPRNAGDYDTWLSPIIGVE